MLSVGEVGRDPRWGMPLHRHEFHEMVAVLQGRLVVNTPETALTAGAGDVLFYRAGVLHEERSDVHKPMHSRFISFELDGLPDSTPFRVHDVYGRIRQLLEWIEDAWMSEAGDSMALCRTFFQAALTEWLHRGSHQDSELVESVRSHVQAHLDRTIRLEDLAARAGMSKYHFARLYKRLAGRTPMQDVRAARLRHAQNLLLTTDLPLKNIAPRCGFSDEYHLAHVFRRTMDMTPGEFRAGSHRRSREG